MEMEEEGEAKGLEGEREETRRTTRNMQIETGDMTPMISTPIDSRMLDSIAFGWGISSSGRG